jgi:monoamine oxidase
VIAYAAKFGLQFVDVAHHKAKKPRPVVLNGKRVTPEEMKETRADVEGSLNKLTEACRPVVPDQPWKTPDAEKLDALSTGDWIKGLEISPLAREMLAAQLVSNNGVAIDLQSQLGNLSQIRGGGIERYWTDSERYRCRGGNDQFAKRLAEGIKAERIQMKTPVTEISIDEKRARVTVASGKTYEADDVVLCTPPTTWSRIQFSPKLPEMLTPQMGNAVKFLNSVRDHFWDRQEMAPGSMSYTGTGHVWLGTENQDPNDPREVLISFISGPTAQNWVKHPADSRIADYRDQLEALQPGFKESVTETRFIDWLSVPWTGGGYSFPAPGQITTLGPILQNGIGRLHFAGEHTCYQFVGYMEGGLHSGVDAAKRILHRTRV